MYNRNFDLDQLRFARRRERERRADARPLRSFPICPKMELCTVPFKLWALIARDVCDVMALKPYRRAMLWREYALDMHYMGFEPQLSSNFGLSETFP